MQFDNFTIRPITREDAQSYYRFITENRERIARYFPDTAAGNTSLDTTISFIAHRLGLWSGKEAFYYVICDNGTGDIIGSLYIKNFDWNALKCELSFFIDRKYEGKGVTTKAVGLMADHCFRELQMNKIFLRIAENNIPSRRVAEKNGFAAEGILRQDFKTPDGEWIDLVYYGLLNPHH
ncbi:MAG TPA: GNAT family N-acetyltransferase [Bacteroidota bacterium]|nr:GNAT family N-acetyltransferase [Bacteroidota bacterium]